jgi:hypothetical protein
MQFWLALHIIAAGVWLGANVAQLVMGARLRSAGAEVRAWWAEAGEFLGKAVYPAAGAVLLITGIILVIQGNYSFGSTFVSIGFLAVIIGAVLGGVVFGPKNRAVAQAARGGDTEGETKARTTIINVAVLDTAIVVATIFVMVYAVGAKFT